MTLEDLAPQRLFSMEGQVVLLTGAAGGIASGLARGFAAAGARLGLADRSEAVEARAEALRAAGLCADPAVRAWLRARAEEGEAGG